MGLVTERGVILGVAALLGALASCANGDPTPPSDGAGAGSAAAVPCPEGAVEACYSGPPGTLGVSHCEGGERRCEGGQWSPCQGEMTPTAELCNGEDDDCDGLADNGSPGAGSACATGLKGLCALGTSMCKKGVLQCVAAVPPTVEVCDAVDNDCDGEVDEHVAASGKACSTGMPSACAEGTYVCAGGALVCAPAVAPSIEKCNDIDDDCDGVVDNDIGDVGQSCDTGLKGTCAKGQEACVKGELKCMSPKVMAEPETCDGVDQNCDGIQDDDVCLTAHLEAVADTTVYTYNPDWNEGSSSFLAMNKTGTAVYLRFDLTSVPSGAQVLHVRLEMVAYGSDFVDESNAYTTLLLGDAWDEQTVTWKNGPPFDAKALGSWSLWFDEEPKDQLGVNADPLLVKPVQEALDSDKLISFRLTSTKSSAYYYSREHGNVQQRPKLVVQYAEKP